MDEIVKTLASSTLQFQKETRNSIKNLETQVSQLANTVGRLEAQGSGKLPSQTIMNPKENVSVITLRGGKQLDEVSKKVTKASNKESQQGIFRGVIDEATSLIEIGEPPKTMHRTEIQPIVQALSFLSRFARPTKEENEKEILHTFRKVQVNIPLLDTIKQVPQHAKLLKELCTNKCKLMGDDKVRVAENVSVILQQKLPQKCKYLGTFTILCTIGNT